MRVKAKDIENFDELLSDAECVASTDWEIGFVEDLKERYEKWGAELYLSDRQADRLETIAERRTGWVQR